MNQKSQTQTSRFFNIETKWLVLLAVGVGTFMSALDGSVVNVIFPVVQAYLKTKSSFIKLFVNSSRGYFSSTLAGRKEHGRQSFRIKPH